MIRTVVIAALVLAGACEGGGDEPLSLHARPKRMMLTCGVGPSFPPSALEGPADVGFFPAAEALRANRKGFPLVPGDQQWRMLGRSDSQVLFGPGDAGKGTDDGGGFGYALVERQGDSWEISGSGGCVPRVARKGLGATNWEPEGAVGGDVTTFVATVVEQACAGGASSEGRVYPPDIEYRADAVLVTFWVKPLKAGIYTCQGNPATRYEVRLREPLGTRQLLDGGVYPPRKPSLRP